MDQVLDAKDSQENFFDDAAEKRSNHVTTASSVSQLENQIEQFSFPLRGNNINPMVEASDNLFAFIIRINSLNKFDDIEHLYQQVNDEIMALDTELRESGNYDQATMLTCRYCLCTVIDETVLRTEWGRESLWSNQSLLSKHHGETWGGDKFYKILSRLMMNPEKYRDLLEFMYFCLSLGYEGKYGLDRQGVSERKVIIGELYDVLTQYWEKPINILTNADKYTVKKNYLLQVNIPPWLIYIFAIALLVAIYQIFNFLLDEEIDPILQRLNELVKER